jgi:AcrR family transcriptional regulator
MASGRRTRQDFYDAAFAVLEESGFPALTVSALCERLAVTRGSFYHHFDSFESFVIGLLADWETRYSRELITRAETVTDLVGRLRYHIELAVALPHGAEAALRAWAAVDRNVATAQSRIDQVRYDYLARLLLGHGVDQREAEAFSSLALNALIGFQMTEPAGSTGKLAVMYDYLIRCLTGDGRPVSERSRPGQWQAG